MARDLAELARSYVVQVDGDRFVNLGAEIERLRAVIRVNGLRAGATHSEIDALLGDYASAGEPNGGKGT